MNSFEGAADRNCAHLSKHLKLAIKAQFGTLLAFQNEVLPYANQRLNQNHGFDWELIFVISQALDRPARELFLEVFAPPEEFEPTKELRELVIEMRRRLQPTASPVVAVSVGKFEERVSGIMSELVKQSGLSFRAIDELLGNDPKQRTTYRKIQRQFGYSIRSYFEILAAIGAEPWQLFERLFPPGPETLSRYGLDQLVEELTVAAGVEVAVETE